MREIRKRQFRQGVVVVAAALSLTLIAACADDDGSAGGSDGGGGGAAATTLSQQEKDQLEERLIQLANEQTQQSGSVSGGGYGYSPADGFVDGYSSDWQSDLERCQALADAVGELDGPAGTVPVRIVSPRNDGTGEFDVLASGRGGEVCEEQ